MEFDDLEMPSQVTSRVSRFVPKSSKLKPNKEPQLVQKIEPQEIDLTAKHNEDCIETITPTHMKSEHNGTVKIEAESKSEAEQDSRNVDSMEVEMTKAEEDSTEVNPMDEDNEEDIVVREIDVFFSPIIDDDSKLYVMQYPLRPSWRPYELDERCEEVMLKPDSLDVAVDLSVDLESSTVDREFSNTLKYTKQTLSTTWKPFPANGCAVGILMGDKLHLHPIHAVVQLRPSRHYLDSSGSEKKNVATSKNLNKQLEPSTSDGGQCWIPLKYHGCKSEISSRYFQQMVARESFTIDFEMSAYDYISALCGMNHNSLAKGPSTRRLLSLPVEKRLETLLIEGPPLHRFSAIKYFAPEYSNEELLSFLQKHALLLQGYWVPRGSLLYPNGGVESLARNYVLVLFHKSLKVRFADVRIWSDRVKHFLKQFALEQVDLKCVKYWKFKELSDESFIKEFPNVVIQQEIFFKILEEEVTKVVYDIGKHKLSKVR